MSKVCEQTLKLAWENLAWMFEATVNAWSLDTKIR